MQIKTLIVDDEPLARKGLAIRLAEYSNIEIIGECKNGLEALDNIPTLNPDLVFLDIQMPGLNGFQVLSKLREQAHSLPLIVFVTAFDSYAIKAFEIHAIDYILKPVEDERLKAAINKVSHYLAAKEQNGNHAKLAQLVADFTGSDSTDILHKLASGETIGPRTFANVLAIKDGAEITRVPIQDVQWIDAAGDYMCVHTTARTHIMRRTMKELENNLDPKVFVRVHRSVIVNIQYVEKLVSHISGEYHLILSNKEELKVSRSYRDRVKQMIKS
ncbi:LytTR family DNA-binding domain-containing protein [Paraglaciecola aquimarina]|uniref:LytTR family DNA-binding domain-containing protein n=1 Tax=Paraglaciecola aquimarina TaxID=1235557 RepID=A0ABU3SXY4_9ALTE|nr:LytTR family DNA-binding domain-containing protein [Paraglaciecola aquimarina]MDU0354858.1 LytTR family DNA-binding domain-containing protein [Paraglaciecola aquimarina]